MHNEHSLPGHEFEFGWHQIIYSMKSIRFEWKFFHRRKFELEGDFSQDNITMNIRYWARVVIKITDFVPMKIIHHARDVYRWPRTLISRYILVVPLGILCNELLVTSDSSHEHNTNKTMNGAAWQPHIPTVLFIHKSRAHKPNVLIVVFMSFGWHIVFMNEIKKKKKHVSVTLPSSLGSISSWVKFYYIFIIDHCLTHEKQ